MRTKSSTKGFTLIELLIVIAILGGLASLVMVAYPASQKKARDAQRQSDVKQYQTLIEIYASSNNNQFPSVTSGNIANLCGALTHSPCVNDPVTGMNYGAAASTTEYQIWAEMENVDENGDTQFFVSCSNGQSGLYVSTTAPSGTACVI